MLAAIFSGLVLWMRYDLPELSTPAYTLGYLLYATLYGFNTWLWMIAFLGLSGRYLSRSNAFLRYFNRASYPLYILHGVPMPIIGYYVTRWRTGPIGEFILLTVLTYAVTLLLYELLVKRTRATRFLFGMKS